MEIHTILGKNEGILDSNGKLFTVQATDKTATAVKTNLICPDCKLKFATKKTLTYHLKYKHNESRRVFICPDCKGHFANAWSVYRHLYKVHRKSAAYIKRVREQINNSMISKEVIAAKKKDKTDLEAVDPPDEENQVNTDHFHPNKDTFYSQWNHFTVTIVFSEYHLPHWVKDFWYYKPNIGFN